MSLVFTPVVDALANTLIVSDSAVVSGLTLGTKTIQIVGAGEMSIDGGGWVTSGVVQNGSAVRLRITTPAGELGQVTTVTVDLQSVGYIEWSVTNRDLLMDEVGAGYDAAVAFSVSPGAPIDEAADASDEPLGDSFPLMAEAGEGYDEATYALTTGVTLVEAGSGDGLGFSAPEALVDESASAVDTLLGTLVLQTIEAGVGDDALYPSLLVSPTVSEQGSGVDAIVTQASTEQIDEDGAGADSTYVSNNVSVLVADVGEGVSAMIETSAPTEEVDEFGAAEAILLPTNNVSINFDNVGYGLDEILLSYASHGAWVFNARSMAMSRWDALQVTEVHEANGVVYGLAADGIYTMSPTVAAAAEVESGLYDFGVIELKHLRHLYVTYTSNTPIHVGVLHSNGAGKQRILYGKPAYSADSPVQTRVNLGRGPLARYWGMTVSNTLGGFASVKDLRLVANVTTRRI